VAHEHHSYVASAMDVYVQPSNCVKMLNAH